MNQPTEPPADTAAAIEMWARLLCAADVHVNDGDHPSWQQLSTTPGRGQDEYRKAARWLMGRVIVPPEIIRAKHFRDAADVIEQQQAKLDAEIQAEYGELDRDTEIEGTATRGMADLLRRMAEEARS